MEIPGYTGVTRVARGGFATVYRATEAATGRIVAIKVLDRIGPKEERRFSREFQTLDQLTGHPNVLEVRGLTRDDEGRPCLVLEYMPGGSLVDLMDEHPAGLDQGDAAYIADNVLAALEAAHEAGVLHRDIKPSNVLLGNDRIKLADFGIAKFTDSAATTSTAISTTVLFAAPEVIMDRDASAQSDLYSLGATVFSLLAGRPPHGSIAEALATAAAGTSVDASLPNVSEKFGAWVAGLLAADPGERPVSAAAARESLQPLVPARPGGELARTMALRSIEARPAIDPPTALQTTRLGPPPEDDVERATPRRLAPAWIGGGALVLVAAIVGLVALLSGDDPAAPQPGTASPGVTTSEAPAATTTAPATDVPADSGLVVVPDVTGSSDPSSDLAAAGLLAVITTAGDDTVPAGVVISQNPVAGTEVERGAQVAVVVSSGPTPVEVPDIAAAGDPGAELIAAGFAVTEATAYSDSVPAGGVIGTDPPIGTLLAPGSAVELILSLGPSVVISIVDDAGSGVGRHNDVAIGADGRAVMSYHADSTVRVARCVDDLCTGTITTPIDLAVSGVLGLGSTAITIGGDGLPLVVYDDMSDYSVWAVHCRTPDCSSAIGVFLEAKALGKLDALTAPSGLVVFTYNKLPDDFQLSSSGIELGDAQTDVIVAACTNADCTGATRNPVMTYAWPANDVTTEIGRERNSATIVDGVPQVLMDVRDELLVADCERTDCGEHTVVDPRAGTPRGGSQGTTSFTTGSDGIGLFTYADTDGALWVGHCADGDCFGSTLTRVPWDSVLYGASNAVAVGSDGLGVIAFYDGANGDLVVAHCDDIRCTEMSVRAIDTAGDVGGNVSIAAAPDGPLFIAYYDATNERLKVAACLLPGCA